VKSAFSPKLSNLECSKCFYIEKELGIEQNFIVSFPKHVIFYIDPAEEDELKKRKAVTTLKYYPKVIDLSKYADEDVEKPQGKYTLTAIIVHPPKTSLDKGMYSAIVKKRIKQETRKQWLLFEDGKFTAIDKNKALTYPAQILFYTRILSSYEDDEEIE